VINLPDLGIKANPHMVTMDKNNNAVADVIEKWLKDHGLTIESREGETGVAGNGKE
jgi:hypothetical protein